MTISNKTAAELLCNAFEGGSNYWYVITNINEPDVLAKPWGDGYTPSYIAVPFSVGGAVTIADIEDDDTTATLNIDAIAQGVKIMTTNEAYSSYYADVLQENADAETGDVFLQLCLFGEVVYG